jgi:hypothetical protein
MKLIDLKQDLLIEPKIVSRRDFLKTTTALLLSSTATTTSAIPILLIPAVLAIGRSIIKGIIKKTIKYALQELKKREVKSIIALERNVREEVIDRVTDIISHYLSIKITRAFVENCLVEYDILRNELEAAWDIANTNLLAIKFNNPTEKIITTKIDMKIIDLNSNIFDKYNKSYYLEVNPNKSISFDIPFSSLPKKGIKNIVLNGNKSALDLKISRSKNIMVETILV